MGSEMCIRDSLISDDIVEIVELQSRIGDIPCRFYIFYVMKDELTEGLCLRICSISKGRSTSFLIYLAYTGWGLSPYSIYEFYSSLLSMQ